MLFCTMKHFRAEPLRRCQVGGRSPMTALPQRHPLRTPPRKQSASHSRRVFIDYDSSPGHWSHSPNFCRKGSNSLWGIECMMTTRPDEISQLPPHQYILVTRLETLWQKSHEKAREDFIRTSICDKYSGSMKITTRLDHTSHCKTASGTNWSNRWTYRVFIINTRRD